MSLARGQVINIGSGQEISLIELKQKIETILGRPIPCQHRSPRPGDVRRHLADITLLKSLVDFEPQVSLDEGLALTWEWTRRRTEVRRPVTGSDPVKKRQAPPA